MPAMEIDLAFFDGDNLLIRGTIECRTAQQLKVLANNSDYSFHVTHTFETPASPVEIVCRKNGKKEYEAALMVGVHDSDDWESINLANIHTLGFRCRVLDEGAA